MKPFPFSFRSRPLTAIFLTVALLFGATACQRHRQPLPKELFEPTAALAQINRAPIFYNAIAREWLTKLQPELLGADGKNPQSQQARDFARAQVDPQFWRELDRREHFAAALIVGDPQSSSMLIDYLVASSDWALSYLDQNSLIFRRKPMNAWSPADFAAVEKRFANRPAQERAEFYNLAANKALAIHQRDFAKDCLDKALKLDSDNAEIWTQLATYDAETLHWNDALTATNRALKIDPKNTSAQFAKAQILYTLLRADEAYAVTSRLAAQFPDSLGILDLHAKVSHMAHAYDDEIATLKHLISLLEAAHLSTTQQRVFLGQAYAHKGEAQLAIEQLTLALKDPIIQGVARKNIENMLDRIRTSGVSTAQ